MKLDLDSALAYPGTVRVAFRRSDGEYRVRDFHCSADLERWLEGTYNSEIEYLLGL